MIDLNFLSRLIFTRDIFGLLGFLVFLYFSLSLYADSKITDNDLTPHTGKITQIDSVITRAKNKPLHKEITQELRVTIDTYPGYFTSTSNENFGRIVSHIRWGDTVTVYTKPKVAGFFGLKKENYIAKLTKKKSIIVDYSKYKKQASFIFRLSLIISFLFLGFFIHRIQKNYLDYRNSIS